MNRVQQVLSRKGSTAVSVTPGISVLEALTIMAEKNIGSVIVMQDDSFLGIVTERDYSRKVILQNKHSDTTRDSNHNHPTFTSDIAQPIHLPPTRLPTTTSSTPFPPWPTPSKSANASRPSSPTSPPRTPPSKKPPSTR